MMENDLNIIKKEQQNEYYIPKLEDLFIGYIFEQKHADEKYHKNILNNEVDFDDIIRALKIYKKDECCNIRTKYLDRSDIESLGWKYQREYDKEIVYNGKYPTKIEFEYGNTWKDKSNGGFLEFKPELHFIKITTTDEGFNRDGPNHSIKFQGEIKSINELRTIMKFLNINGKNL